MKHVGTLQREPLTAFKLNPPKVAPDVAPKGRVTRLTRWQTSMYGQLESQRFRSITTPTGSGKSVGVIALAGHDTLDAYKVLIAVPQVIVADSFSAREMLLPDGTLFDWNPQSVSDATTGGQVQAVVDFVTKPLNAATIKVLVCTHQALVLAYDRIKKMKLKKNPWKSVSLFVDEAHHTKVPEEYNWDEKKTQNRLGAVVKHYLDLNNPPLTMITATWGRTDTQIMSAADFVKFDRFYMSVYDHLAHCQHLQDVEQRFVAGPMLDTTVYLLEKSAGRKTMVYLPRIGSALTTEEKAPLVASLIKHIRQIPKLKNSRIVDLVNSEGREERLAAMRAAIANNDVKSLPDIIIALNIGTEGFNYPALEYIIQMAPRGSYIEAQQILGRLLRDHPGKAHVRLDVVLPQEQGEFQEDGLARFFRLLVGSMVVDLQEQLSHLHLKSSLSKALSEDQRTDVARGGARLAADSRLAPLLQEAAELAIRTDEDEARVKENIRRSVEEILSEDPTLAQPAKEALAKSVFDFLGAPEKKLADSLDLDLPLKREVLNSPFGRLRLFGLLLDCPTLAKLKKKLKLGERGVGAWSEATIIGEMFAYRGKIGRWPTVSPQPISAKEPRTWVSADGWLKRYCAKGLLEVADELTGAKEPARMSKDELRRQVLDTVASGSRATSKDRSPSGHSLLEIDRNLKKKYGSSLDAVRDEARTVLVSRTQREIST